MIPVKPPHGGAGYVTTAGVGTIPDGDATLIVAHGLGATPTSVTVTPGGEARLWVTDIDGTNFTVNRANIESALPLPAFGRSGIIGALTVYWRVDA